jgi:hypothetical protein
VAIRARNELHTASILSMIETFDARLRFRIDQ